MPPAARLGDTDLPRRHRRPPPPAGRAAACPTVLIGGMPAAVVGSTHVCVVPPHAALGPANVIMPGPPGRQRPGAHRRAARRAGRRPHHLRGHHRPRRPDRPTSEDRCERAASSAAAGRSRCASGPPAASAMVEREQEIEEAIRLILGTAPGERPMRPEFGCGIHELRVRRRPTRATAGRIAHEVRDRAGAVGAADRGRRRGGRLRRGRRRHPLHRRPLHAFAPPTTGATWSSPSTRSPTRSGVRT